MECDLLMLADSAQAVDGKLYILGGGWRAVTGQRLPFSHPMAIAVGFLVDWTETNRQHQFNLTIQADDTKENLAQLEGTLEVGRPVGIPAGTQQRALFALNMTPEFKSDGPYTVSLLVDGQDLARTSFTVIDASKKAEPFTQPPP